MFFDERTTAQKAIDDIVAAGVPDTRIRPTEGIGTTPVTERVPAPPDESFWDELRDLFQPKQDRHGYAEGLP